eukprot:1159436-Pelagomonas_calceolata.AAC.3
MNASWFINDKSLLMYVQCLHLKVHFQPSTPLLLLSLLMQYLCLEAVLAGACLGRQACPTPAGAIVSLAAMPGGLAIHLLMGGRPLL